MKTDGRMKRKTVITLDKSNLHFLTSKGMNADQIGLCNPARLPKIEMLFQRFVNYEIAHFQALRKNYVLFYKTCIL